MHEIIRTRVSLLFIILLLSCETSDNPLFCVLNDDKILKEVVEDQKYEVQILYTQVNKGKDSVVFRTYRFGLDSSKYFYPASTVKFPIALLALQKLNELNLEGLTRETHMYTDSAYSGQTHAFVDSTSLDLTPSIGQYIKKIFAVSDNDGYNRLYEFLGQDYIHHSLKMRGYIDTRIVHRLSVLLSPEQNRRYNPIYFIHNDDTIYHEPLRSSKKSYVSASEISKGVGYLKNDSIIMQPFDFTYKNYFPLHEQHQMIRALFYPDFFPGNTFNLTSDDLLFLKKYMSILPKESGIEAYSDTSVYYDSYVKFFIFGDSKEPMPDHVKIYNKIGMAYGYLIDNAYIIDQENQVEFFLSAVIHVNRNRIYNDGIYEYEEVGLPFLARLGSELYNYEINRKKNH